LVNQKSGKRFVNPLKGIYETDRTDKKQEKNESGKTDSAGRIIAHKIG
jgi:hypothetical protein